MAKKKKLPKLSPQDPNEGAGPEEILAHQLRDEAFAVCETYRTGKLEAHNWLTDLVSRPCHGDQVRAGLKVLAVFESLDAAAQADASHCYLAWQGIFFQRYQNDPDRLLAQQYRIVIDDARRPTFYGCICGIGCKCGQCPPPACRSNLTK